MYFISYKGGGSIATGYIKVFAHERDQRPLADTLVRIYRTENEIVYLEYEVYTDADGMTPLIPLSAPDQQLSQNPHHSIQPYSTYDVSVSKDGYDIEERHGVQIFDQISSTLDVELQPISGGSRQRYVRVISPHSLYNDVEDFYA